jgi:hypothetical protein
MLDCCHSGSATRPTGTQYRRVTFESPDGEPLTIPNSYDLDWQKSSEDGTDRGAFLPFKFLHHGLRSHTVLAACSSTEYASEIQQRGLFTQKLLSVLEEHVASNTLHRLTYVNLVSALGAVTIQ